MKERYDLSSQGKTLERGDAVWLFNPQKKGATPKLSRNWKGPYVVIKWINDVIYRIQLGPRTKPRIVHRKRLWKYSGQSPPTWLKTTAKQATLTETDHSIEGEVSCSTTATDDSTDQKEGGNDDGSHPDKQCNNSAARRSTRR